MALRRVPGVCLHTGGFKAGASSTLAAKGLMHARNLNQHQKPLTCIGGFYRCRHELGQRSALAAHRRIHARRVAEHKAIHLVLLVALREVVAAERACQVGPAQ